jgi:hypothetical protein
MPGPDVNPGLERSDMPKRIPIKALKEFAKQEGLTHAILFAFDGKLQHVVTHGSNSDKCSEAADFGNKLKEALGWPESLQAHPSTVKRLQKRIKELEQELKVFTG